MSELKACPFCGALALEPVRISELRQQPIWEIRCPCFCTCRRFDTKKGVIKTWNTRTLPPEVQTVLDAAKKWEETEYASTENLSGEQMSQLHTETNRRRDVLRAAVKALKDKE